MDIQIEQSASGLYHLTSPDVHRPVCFGCFQCKNALDAVGDVYREILAANATTESPDT
ncbi:hypothetical protein P7F88_25315 [Vibrio hannami]|uniref:hypothetical protein n=1 Tax=Vibrio hannami TaxID=2717094 RepID=UPI00240EDEB7|nr:hypothetical protein [Vibrio hannami]MDG3089185.1 hypothetical protein [Vibrio hannami]